MRMRQERKMRSVLIKLFDTSSIFPPNNHPVLLVTYRLLMTDSQKISVIRLFSRVHGFFSMLRFGFPIDYRRSKTKIVYYTCKLIMEGTGAAMARIFLFDVVSVEELSKILG